MVDDKAAEELSCAPRVREKCARRLARKYEPPLAMNRYRDDFTIQCSHCAEKTHSEVDSLAGVPGARGLLSAANTSG